jgi:1,4-dihydroxy-6-naphthoate synthase
MTTTELAFGFSPCPNDTFAFHALAAGLVESPLRVRPVLEDIEQLNRRARRGDLPLTKLSIGALAGLRDRYVPLAAGAALGHGVGPLVVAREPMELARAAAGPIAIPGRDTTAMLLLRLAAGDTLEQVVELRYDEVLPAVAGGHVAAGLVIHEGRFTYASHGLVQVADLGDWWEQRSGQPVPLATICARVDLEPELRGQATRAIRESVLHAMAHPAASAGFVRAHAQELDAEVCRRHIELYVNERSVDLGDEGMAAIEALLQAAGEPGAGAEPTPALR